jgi:hypothetical protein
MARSIDAEIKALLKEATKRIEQAQRSDAKKVVTAHTTQRGLFRRRVRRVWGRAIDELTHLVLRCRELGAASVQDRSIDRLDQALVYSWARGCQTALAISSLLEDGFADDAHARWRTLHELNIVAQFLRQHGDPIVERYFAHVDVKNYNVSREYQRCAPALGYPVEKPATIASLKAKRDAAVAKFPRLAEGDWAWARPALPALTPKRRATFTHLEESVGLAKWRAHVGMAHHNVHAGPHGALFRLGLPSGSRAIAIAGPSLHGLADPGHSTGISLVQLTQQLVMPRSADDHRDPMHVAAASALLPLLDRVGRLFGAAHRRQEPSRRSG